MSEGLLSFGSHEHGGSIESSASDRRSSELSLGSFADQKIVSSLTCYSSSNSTSSNTTHPYSGNLKDENRKQKTYDASDYVTAGKENLLPTFEIESLQKEIDSCLSGHMKIYPKSIERYLRQHHGDFIERMKETFKEALVYVSYSLLVALNIDYQHSIPKSLMFDACIFSRNNPVTVLSVQDMEQEEHKLDKYNARICQNITVHLRKEFTNFRAVNGVISCKLLSSTDCFVDWFKKTKKIEGHIPSLDTKAWQSAVALFLKLIARLSSPEMSKQNNEETLFFVEGAFQLLIDIMEERLAVVVTAIDSELLRCLVAEITHRLTTSGKTDILARHPEHIPYIQNLRRQFQNVNLKAIGATQNESLKLEQEDICISSQWTGTSHWIFIKKNTREHVRRPANSDVVKGEVKPSVLDFTQKHTETYPDAGTPDYVRNEHRRKIANSVVKGVAEQFHITDTEEIEKLTSMMMSNLKQCEERTAIFLSDELKTRKSSTDIEKTNAFLEDTIMTTFRQRHSGLKDVFDPAESLPRFQHSGSTRARKTRPCTFCMAKESTEPLVDNLQEVLQMSSSLRSNITETSIPQIERWTLLFEKNERNRRNCKRN